jgi:hypothetical protein
MKMKQVTEFRCGGFVVGLISVHTITDGMGARQFVNAVADYARGLPAPRVPPVWAHDLVPDPPMMPAPAPRLDLLQQRYFTVDLSPAVIANTKARFLEATGQRCSAFDVCVAQTWQARTRAVVPPPPTTPTPVGTSTSASSPTRATSSSRPRPPGVLRKLLLHGDGDAAGGRGVARRRGGGGARRPRR